MLKSKEGISPILATLLLIVIAVAAVIVTYAWVMTFTSSQTGQAGVFLRKDVDCLWETGNVTVYVRNTGTSDASWTPNTEYRFQISPRVGNPLSFTESSPSA